MSTYLNLFVTKKFQQQGSNEEQTQYIKVGAAFPNKGGGFGIEITEGIAVSGSMVALPPRDKDDTNGNSRSKERNR